MFFYVLGCYILFRVLEYLLTVMLKRVFKNKLNKSPLMNIDKEEEETIPIIFPKNKKKHNVQKTKSNQDIVCTDKTDNGTISIKSGNKITTITKSEFKSLKNSEKISFMVGFCASTLCDIIGPFVDLL